MDKFAIALVVMIAGYALFVLRRIYIDMENTHKAESIINKIEFLLVKMLIRQSIQDTNTNRNHAADIIVLCNELEEHVKNNMDINTRKHYIDCVAVVKKEIAEFL